MILPKELRALIGKPVLPFIGAGLAVDAGVPRRRGLLSSCVTAVAWIESLPADSSGVSHRHSKTKMRIGPTEELVRTVIRELAVSATPTLTALAGCPGRRHPHHRLRRRDRAIGATSRSDSPILSERTSAQPMLPPPQGEVAGGIHAHGLAASSIPSFSWQKHSQACPRSGLLRTPCGSAG